MPNYDYHCTECGQETEIFQRMSDPPARQCPSCGKDGLERLISRSAFTLKGEGWYADGYGAKPAEKKASSADKPAQSEGSKEAAPSSSPASPASPSPAPKKDGPTKSAA